MRVPALAGLVALAALVAAPAVGAAAPGATGTAGPADDTATTALRSANHTATGTVNATVSRARGALFDDLTDVESLRAARENGTLVRSYLRIDDRAVRPAFVPGDVLVVRLESERLASALRARNGSTPTERYLDYVNRTAARLQLVQTPRTTRPESQRQRIAVNESRIRVLAENDTRWVLLDTGNATARYGTSGPTYDDIHGGQEYGVWFDFAATVEGLPEVGDRPRVAVADPEVAFDAGPGRERLYLSPVADAPVRVSSTLAPGTEVRLRAHYSNRTAVRELVLRGRNRTAATARLDLSGYADGRTVRLSAVRDGETVAEATAAVDVPNATLRVAERDPWDAVVTVTANLSRGGTVVVQSPDGSVVYDSTTVEPWEATTRVLYLPATELTNRTRFAVVAYRSLEDDPVAGDAVPYREDGSPVRTTGVYDPDAGPPSPTPTSSPTVTPAVTPTATPTADTSPTARPVTGTGTPVASDPATDGDGAGVGPLATVLAVALAVAASGLVGRRR